MVEHIPEISLTLAGVAVGAKFTLETVQAVMGMVKNGKKNGHVSWENVVRYVGSEKAVLEQRLSEGERSFARIEEFMRDQTELLREMQRVCSSRGERLASLEARGR